MSVRKQIRDAAKTAVAASYSGTLFTSRNIDVRDLSEYMSIYLANGEIDKRFQVQTSEAILVVEYNKDAEDDDLDTVIDAAHEALMANFNDQLIVEGFTAGAQIIPESFEYGIDESRQFSSVSYSYRITFSA
tara:strand:- start:80 stop:475 length:396 start_codon:yes stop_codon:yes gene_type:complete